MVWPNDAWRGIWYSLAGMALYMVWPGGHGIRYGLAGITGIEYGLAMYSMVYGMTWQCMAWYMVWPGGHGMVYGMARRAWHGIRYGIVGMAWYIY